MIGNYIVNDTKEDMLIEDKPASWGNAGFYRLFTGDDKEVIGDANFSKQKLRVLRGNYGLLICILYLFLHLCIQQNSNTYEK